MRMVVIGLFGLALARPFLPLSAMASVAGARMHRVIVLDNSMSMSATNDNGESRFVRAMSVVRGLVERAAANDALCVLTLGGQADAITAKETYDRRMVLDRLATLDVTEAGTDVVGGLQLAIDVLDDSDFVPGQREVVVVSDFAGTSWGETSDDDEESDVRRTLAALTRQLADAATVTLIEVAGDDQSNLAVAAFVEVGSVPAGSDVPMQLSVTVSHDGGVQSAGGAVVDVFAGDRLVRRLMLDAVPIGGAQTERFALRSVDVAGQTLQARLRPVAADAIVGDNVRYLGARESDAIRVLIVDDQGALGHAAGAGTYLSAALQPGGETTRGGWFALTIVSSEDLANEVLGAYDVVVMAHVGRLSTEMWGKVERYVRRGGSLLVAGSEFLDVGQFADVALLPVTMHGTWDGDRERNERVSFSKSTAVHAALADFAQHPSTGLFSTRVWRYLQIEPNADADVWLRFDDGQPAIVSHNFGDGAVCVFATSLDVSWNNLPAKGDYVALMINVVGHLGRAGDGGPSLLVGERFVRGVTEREAAQGARVETPTGETVDVLVEHDERGERVVYGPVPVAGSYRVRVGDRDIAFVANVPTGESDVTGVGESGLRDVFEGPVRYVALGDGAAFELEPPVPTHEMAGGMLGLVALLLLGETWLATRLGASR